MEDLGIKSKDILVSVIVPAYNVAKYIEKCLESILLQSYQPLEIIVIDDGSNDDTKRIVENLAINNNLIKFYHQENKGVSAARNCGIEHSVGDYLIFVDGDDYLAKDFIEYMVDLVKKTNAELCLSTDCYTKINEKQCSSDKIRILSPAEGARLLLSPEVKVGCWNKIFKKSLLTENNIYFSTSLFYGEGLRFITQSAQLANKVGVGNRKVYYYRRNNESSATTKFNIDSLINGEKSIDTIEKTLLLDDKDLKRMLCFHRTLFYLGAIVRLKSEGVHKKYKEYYKRWKSYVRRNSRKFIFDKNLSLYRKVLVLLGWINPGFVSFLDKKRRKRNFRNSIE